MSADVIMTQHVMLSGIVQMTDFVDMSGRHSQHFCELLGMLARHVIWGVSRHNTTPAFPTKFINNLVIHIHMRLVFTFGVAIGLALPIISYFVQVSQEGNVKQHVPT